MEMAAATDKEILFTTILLVRFVTAAYSNFAALQ
jgi:hypothetical protein